MNNVQRFIEASAGMGLAEIHSAVVDSMLFEAGEADLVAAYLFAASR